MHLPKKENTNGRSQLNVEVQPTKNGKAYYLPIAAKSDGDPEMVKVVLRLRITNNETKPVTGITFSFPNKNISVRHGDVKVLYTHFQKGSIPVALRQVNATVTAGQTLGLAGNSGRSDAPHLVVPQRAVP